MRVTFEGVTKKYGDFTAVRDLSLTIEDGALHFLLGPSGCGKTTTLRLLAGLETLTQGRILFDDQDVTKVDSADRGIGMVFQNYALWPHMTVTQNVEYGLKLRKLSRSEVSDRVRDVLGYTRLEPFATRLPGQLSGGQQQRVALARAMAIRPNVLLLDEPLSNLDAKLRLEMRDNITSIHQQTGITTVYVTHDQKEALSMGTAVSIQRAGQIVQTDSPRQLYWKPATPFVAGFIGETNLIAGTYLGDRRVETALGEWALDEVGEDFAAGDAVTLSVRPESVVVHLDDDTPATTSSLGNPVNGFTLRLKHLTYLGDTEHLRLGDDADTELKASLFNVEAHHLAPDDIVRCSVRPSALRMFQPEHDLSPGT
jgi:putative spermidine/putrescine transport system ATP-binding protein